MPPTTAEEEDLNSALIAHLLAEDRKESEMYYNEYGNSGYYDRYVGIGDERDDSYEEGSEDDYAPKQNKKSKKKKAKKAEEKEKKKGTQRVKKGKKNNDEVDEQNNHDQSTSTLVNNVENGTATSETEKNVPSTTATVNEDASTTTVPKATTTTGKTSKTEKPKKEKKPLPPGMNGGVYTDAEEVLFLEGLNLYGRNWADLAKHIGTRESHSVRSHAQKHFIKLYRDNLPLPDKVKESGEGYTLSGKPLDPNSAAAKPYLNRGGSTTEAITAKVENIKITQPESNEDDKNTDNNESNSELTNTQTPSSTPVVTLKRSKSESTQPKPKKAKLPSKPKTQKKPNEKQTEKQTEPTTTYDENGRTRYASSRLRSQQQKSDSTYEVIGLNSDPLTLVKCGEFDRNVDRSHANAQPFSLGIDTNTLLVMDFHAHLMTTEIIGLLAGTWDWKQRRIEIKEAFPCKSLNTGQNEVNVEMDPSSAFEVRQMIEQKNMKVVGWYHSHPTFVPDPSLIDIENQHNYQKLSQDKYTIEPTKTESPSSLPTSSTIADDTSLSSSEKNEQPKTITFEPFVGAIVTPYDPDLTTSASAINWFYVSNNEHTNNNIPRRLEYEVIESMKLSEEEEQRMLGLLEEYKDSPEKTKFNDVWKVDSTENKLIKLIKSIASRMPWIERQLVNKLNNDVNSKNDNNTDTTTTTTTTAMDDIKMNEANTNTASTVTSNDKISDNNAGTATIKATNDNTMDDDSTDTATMTNENKMNDDDNETTTLTSDNVDTTSTTTTNDINDKDITMKEGDNQNLQQMDIDKDYNILDEFLQKIEKLIKDW
ncbi:hypothetical protein BJ944DRAFT_231160 [Cunninghamella echinulata]|nr:hypothetical protein BJ944DRAFT_231160 [Cunninghamella echinulata]